MNEYKRVYSIQDIEEYIKDKDTIAFDFETSPRDKFRDEEYAALDPHKSDIVGISLSVREDSGIYIPIKHKVGENLSPKEVLSYLGQAIFLNEDIIKIAHNLSFEAMFLYKEGIIIKEPIYDTIAAAQLTLKSHTRFRELRDSGLKTLGKEIFNENLPSFSEATEGRHFDELHPNHTETIRYACADSDYTLRLYNAINKWFRTYLPRHEYIVRKVESPSAVFTGLMKYNGIKVDTEDMYHKQIEAEETLDNIIKEINILSGRTLNLGSNGSTEDLKKFLYEEMNLPVLKKTTKESRAIDEEALTLLMEWCHNRNGNLTLLISKILEYRKWSKLKSTYIEGITKYINSETGCIHANFYPLGTETGRFSCKNPNMQNLPRKGNDPIGVREGFISREGQVLLSLDFSQIELRTGAFQCRDERMISAYRRNGDIHGETTAIIYGIPYYEAVNKSNPHYKERRAIAKNCNFGIFFGLYPKGLQRTLNIKAGLNKDIKECEEIIANLKRGYPKINEWQIHTKKKANFSKYSETALGRRRILREITSSDWSKKSYWERCALNTPIQGTAADILKLALGRILKELHNYPYIKPILQIHDEIVVEVPVHKVKEASKLLKMIMEEVPFEGFDIPLVAEGAVGYSFGEMKDLP